ncbi:MAG: hypothetical protein P8R31_19635 [Mariniblastus sp.]|nr:hypothetical protein [Mariniblastus sp.]MDG2012688.1 hypothetical protein [Pirellulaceae bacterium]
MCISLCVAQASQIARRSGGLSANCKRDEGEAVATEVFELEQQQNGQVGGGTMTGQFTSSEKVVNVGGGNNSGQQNPMADGSFNVTFTNNSAGSVVIKLFETQRNLLESRTIQVNESFSSTAKFGYTYEQEGPTTSFNGLITTASASGGISPTNPNISLR